MFTIYGHSSHLFSGKGPLEEIVNTLSTESPMWNLKKIAQAVSEKTFKNKMAAVVAISDRHNLTYFKSRSHLVDTASFNSNHPMVWDDKLKIGFQDGGCGSHLGFLIGKILYTFDLQVILLLQCKFQLKLPSGSRADFKNLFSRWWLW